jgi:membrane-bound lytic murein transglycosylase D
MRRYLPRETRNYVPQYIAVTRMALRPDVYGFQNLPKADPLSYEYVTIDDCVDLSILAECAGTTIDTLKELNPELLYPFTPPSTKGYQLRVPLGSKDTFVVRYVLVPNDKKQNWAVHKVRKGETLSTIAKRYRVMVSAIAEVNKISRTRRLSIGKALLIPVPASYASIAQEYPEPSVRRVSRTAKIPHREASIAPAGRKKINYVVKKGETLGHIAEWYGVRTSDLRNWNNVPYGRLLQAGRSLAIWVESSKYDQYTKVAQMSLAEKNKFAKKNRPASDDDAENGMTAGTKKGEGEHLVTRGETLGSIAKKYQLSIAELKEMNDLRGSTVYAGQHLMVKKIDMIRQTKKESASSKKGNDLSTKNTAASKSMTHVVKKGETLERIASKYRVTVTDIKKWNKLTSNKILAGKKLFVQNPASGG